MDTHVLDEGTPVDMQEYLKEIYSAFVGPASRYALRGDNEQATRCLKDMFQHIKRTAHDLGTSSKRQGVLGHVAERLDPEGEARAAEEIAR